MARTIVVSFGGTESIFPFTKLDRKKLYAWRKRVVLDKDDQPCIRAELTRDGSVLFQSSMTSQGYFEPSGRWVANSELVGIDEHGKPLDQQASTLGKAQELEGPIDPSELLDVAVQTVYALDEGDVAPGLKKEIESGKVFKFPFNYRTDYHMETGYLLANKEGWFVLVGEVAEPEWCELETVAPDTFGDDDTGLELDFEMT